MATAAVFCLSTIGYRVLTAPKIPDLAPTVEKVNAEIDEAHRLTLEAGLTAMEARKASAKEISYLDQWNNQFSATINDFQQVMLQTRSTLAAVQGTSEAATSTIQTTQETVAALQAPITQAAATLQAAQRATEALQLAVVHLDVLVSDPAIKDTIAHTDATMGHVDATTGDVQHVVHEWAFPGIWSRVKGVALDIAHAFNPL